MAGRSIPRFQYPGGPGQQGSGSCLRFPVEVARAGSAQSLLPVQGNGRSRRAHRGPDSPRRGRGRAGALVPFPRTKTRTRPLMVYAHFGGGVIGDLDTCEVFCTILAKVARCPVLSVDYRLAPGTPLPRWT